MAYRIGFFWTLDFGVLETERRERVFVLRLFLRNGFSVRVKPTYVNILPFLTRFWRGSALELDRAYELGLE